MTPYKDKERQGEAQKHRDRETNRKGTRETLPCPGRRAEDFRRYRPTCKANAALPHVWLSSRRMLSTLWTIMTSSSATSEVRKVRLSNSWQDLCVFCVCAVQRKMLVANLIPSKS